MFALCGKCIETQQSTKCEHSVEDRKLRGTWQTDELKKALSLGYSLIRIHEVWHFKDMAQYDPKSKTGGLFAGYINAFLKLKQETSGWPKWCDTDAKKDQYISEYKRREGIMLDSTCVERNEGLRAVAKLMLNSFWGKFGQRENMSKTRYIVDPEEFFGLFLDDTKTINHVNFLSDYVAQVQWEFKEHFAMPLSNINICIAAYTTAQARLKLYSFLERLGERVLYYDTDSIIYVSRGDASEYVSPLGDYGEGSYITEFASGGPKNYGYTVYSTNTKMEVSTCKVRGITLNYRNTDIVNYSTLNDLVRVNEHDDTEEEVGGAVINKKRTVHDPHKIVRNPGGEVITRQSTKDYRVVYTKRVMVDDFDTVPYGY